MPEPQPEPEPEPGTQPEPEPEPGPEPETQPEPDPQPKTQPEPQPQPEPENSAGWRDGAASSQPSAHRAHVEGGSSGTKQAMSQRENHDKRHAAAVNIQAVQRGNFARARTVRLRRELIRACARDLVQASIDGATARHTPAVRRGLTLTVLWYVATAKPAALAPCAWRG